MGSSPLESSSNYRTWGEEAREGLSKRLAWYIYVVSFPRGKLHLQTPRTELDSMTQWLNDSLTHWRLPDRQWQEIDSLTDQLTESLIGMLTHWQTDLLTDSLTESLTDCTHCIDCYIDGIFKTGFITTDFYFRIPYNYIKRLMIFSFLWYNGNVCLYC